jgi:uncharacterized protein YecT (DUF1311 family)
VRRALAVLIAAALASPAAAGVDRSKIEARYSPAYGDCLDTPDGQSTAGMIACTDTEMKLQDTRLNAAYAKAMGKLNERQKTALRKAQRAWVAFRDADCASLWDDEWGSLSRVNANGCMLSRTVERTIELQTYPDGE